MVGKIKVNAVVLSLFALGGFDPDVFECDPGKLVAILEIPQSAAENFNDRRTVGIGACPSFYTCGRVR
jgi:hypothetical protein